MQPKKTGPDRQLLRLRVQAQLYAEADAASAPITELAAGDLVEASADIDVLSPPEGGWLLVRAPLEDKVDVMGEKPLEYEDGWIVLDANNATVDRAELQLGEKIAAQVYPETHPVLDILKRLPWWKEPGLPPWLLGSCCELYTGKIAGVAKRGRFLVQRPSGAMPERIATRIAKIVLPRRRFKQTALAGLVGLVVSIALGVGYHAGKWLQGRPFEIGRGAWPPLIGWMTLIVCFLSPISVLPCYYFANSPGATACVIAFMNLLLYHDLFSE